MLESESDPEELEVANIFLMANTDSEEDADKVNRFPISYDELSHAFDILVRFKNGSIKISRS